MSILHLLTPSSRCPETFSPLGAPVRGASPPGVAERAAQTPVRTETEASQVFNLSDSLLS